MTSGHKEACRASKFKHGQVELSTASRVSTGGEALKPNRLDDELIVIF